MENLNATTKTIVERLEKLEQSSTLTGDTTTADQLAALAARIDALEKKVGSDDVTK